MMRLRSGLLAVVLTVAFTCGTHADADKQPFEIVRDLQQLQDRIAEGDAIAQAAHARAIERAARAFSSAKPSVWSDARNARALAVYLFSGGNASLIAATVQEKSIAAPQQALYAGALAYGLGDDEKARKNLLPIDAKSLPGSTGAQLALVQATLYADSDSTRAIALLDLARLLGPGTLVEEAALRKEMSLIGATGDLNKYTALARRYLSAYQRSAYADNFRQLVAAAILQIGAADTDDAGVRIAKLIPSLEPTERCKIYLAIAREAVLSGRIKMAILAGSEAERLSAGTDRNKAKAMVYFGAAAIVGDRYDAGRKILATAKEDRLLPADRALRTAALAVAEMIRKPPAPGAAGLEAKHAGVVEEAERSLAVSDEMLKRAAQ